MIGRWTAKDPIRFASEDVPNLYVYANADPVNFIDQTGRQSQAIPWGPIIGGAGAGAAAGSAAGGVGAIPGALIGACVGALFLTGDTPDLKERCYGSYLSDTAYCGETYPDDHRYNICMENAWKRYIRCLNGLPPGGPLVPR